MLRFDRYLVAHSRTLDLTSGNLVDVEHARVTSASCAPLFTSRAARTLIDVEPAPNGRIEIWEHWRARRPPLALADTIATFCEAMDCARLGAPRPFDVVARRPIDREFLQRALAREARLRGWIPIAAEMMGILIKRHRGWPAWLRDRSLVIFVDSAGLSRDAVLAMVRLSQRDTRPHVLVRSLADRDYKWPFLPSGRDAIVHEDVSAFGNAAQPNAAGRSDAAAEHSDKPALAVEAGARWAVMIDEVSGGGEQDVRTLDLAQVLVARDQVFEASALLTRVKGTEPTVLTRQAAIGHEIAERSATRARGWDMVDDFVGVLQLCQDVEDEDAALARVSAYLRERLQASTVAFIARERGGPRVLSRVGCETARVDLAVRSIETGVAIPAGHHEGPVESACPVRHATEVIGAVWCRWSAGTPVATDKATSLLGVAAAATAPSVRLAIARRELASPATSPIPELVGESTAMATVREAILRAANSPFPVVIEGESGSGKELAARAIHARGPRSSRAFCAINCAALVDDLVEAELFGHARGAFTGAATDRAGLFESASGGTLFLDETAELGARVQAKLLRVLQEGEVRRLGESQLRRVDVRVIAATNRPLATEVDAGRFRKDLWYRLDVIRVAMPPLRARLEDIPVLASHIWQTLAQRTNSTAVLSPATIAALGNYDWPGNVRELQNVLASLLVSAPPKGLVGPSTLPNHIARVATFDRAVTLDSARRQFEERYVRAALARAGGRVVVAARELGLSRQGLLKLMKRLGITIES
jgi:DNA-binding NtrC family response regulator